LHVLAVVGSPRRRGNTEILVDRTLEGMRAAAKDRGIDIEIHEAFLQDLRATPLRSSDGSSYRAPDVTAQTSDCTRSWDTSVLGADSLLSRQRTVTPSTRRSRREQGCPASDTDGSPCVSGPVPFHASPDGERRAPALLYTTGIQRRVPQRRVRSVPAGRRALRRSPRPVARRRSTTGGKRPLPTTLNFRPRYVDDRPGRKHGRLPGPLEGTPRHRLRSRYRESHRPWPRRGRG